MPYAVVRKGARIHYTVHGERGPWVVLLMGLGASSAMWLDVPSRLAAHDPPYRVLAIDNLGTGHSDPMSGPRSVRGMAEDAVGVMDDAKVDRAFMVGMSMGGMIAQEVALGFPHRLDGLVLMATSPGLLRGGLPTPRALRSLLRVTLGGWKSRHLAEELVGDLVLPPSERSRAGELIARLAPAFRATPTRGESFAWQLLACALHAPGRKLGTIRTPTVIVTGDSDIVVGKKSSRALAAKIPGSILEVVPSCGHGISFTHPQAVERALARLAS